MYGCIMYIFKAQGTYFYKYIYIQIPNTNVFFSKCILKTLFY